jgi:hypothetical protein
MLRPFDVIMTWPVKWNFISWFIIWITHGGPSHVRVYCKGLGFYRDDKELDFFELTWPKGRFGFMNEISPGDYKIEYGRNSELFYPLPDELKNKGKNAMKALEGTWYDGGELALSQFFDEIGLDHTDNSDPTRFVCSSAAEHILSTMNFPFCVSDQLVSPQDIRKSKFYVKVEGGEEV